MEIVYIIDEIQYDNSFSFEWLLEISEYYFEIGLETCMVIKTNKYTRMQSLCAETSLNFSCQEVQCVSYTGLHYMVTAYMVQLHAHARTNIHAHTLIHTHTSTLTHIWKLTSHMTFS